VSISDDPKRIVERGYDAIADRFAEWARNEVTGSPAIEYLERLLALLPPGADVLELGCGNGEPAARMLAAEHRYTGVDISSEQLRRARALVPTGAFVKADYTKLEQPASCVDAVVALYTFGHVPREELPGLYERIASWLRPGGHLLATAGGRRDDPDNVEEDWLGAPMFFSGFDMETSLRLLAEAGLEVLEHELICQDEGEHGEACFLWVLARRVAQLS
jgi:cyclopropane fatty-acyl-phospholipid synthase-like methyltransferase